MNKELTYYVAGPMTGYDQHNYPAFIEVGKKLREQGYNVLLPVELDTPEEFNRAMGNGFAHEYNADYSNFLARDVMLLSTKADGIIFMPKWQKSRGARLEACVGLLWNLKFGFWDPDTESVQPAEYSQVAEWAV